MPKPTTPTSRTRFITYCAIFIAISVMMTTLRVGPFSFGGFGIIVAGFLLGPAAGAVVGGVSDIVSFLLRPSGPFNPAFTLTSILTGVIPVLVAQLCLLVRKQWQTAPQTPAPERFPIWTVALGIAIGQLITSVTLVPIFWGIFISGKLGTPDFWAVVIARALKALTRQAFNIPLYTVIFAALQRPLAYVMRIKPTREPA